MRLWHQALIPYLDNKRLLSQHRECCALRGKGWGKKHSVVDYVFKYAPARLYAYHLLVMNEMFKRNYDVNPEWFNRMHRGDNMPPYEYLIDIGTYVYHRYDDCPIYPEHDDSYLKECLLNLKSKGASLIGKSIDEMLVKLDLAAVE